MIGIAGALSGREIGLMRRSLARSFAESLPIMMLMIYETSGSVLELKDGGKLIEAFGSSLGVLIGAKKRKKCKALESYTGGITRRNATGARLCILWHLNSLWMLSVRRIL